MKKYLVKYLAIVFLCFLCLSLSVASAERRAPVNQQVDATSTQNDNHDYYSQFDEEYRPPEDVAYRAASLTTAEEPILVFYSDHKLTIEWNSVSDVWSVSRNGRDAKNLIIDNSIFGWILFEAVFHGDRGKRGRSAAEVGGFIATTHDGSFVVQVVDADGVLRSRTPFPVIESNVAIFRGWSRSGQTSAKCNCFGIGKVTSACSTKGCNEGTSCGTKSKACRWSAAS